MLLPSSAATANSRDTPNSNLGTRRPILTTLLCLPQVCVNAAPLTKHSTPQHCTACLREPDGAQMLAKNDDKCRTNQALSNGLTSRTDMPDSNKPRDSPRAGYKLLLYSAQVASTKTSAADEPKTICVALQFHCTRFAMQGATG